MYQNEIEQFAADTKRFSARQRIRHGVSSLGSIALFSLLVAFVTIPYPIEAFI